MPTSICMCMYLPLFFSHVCINSCREHRLRRVMHLKIVSLLVSADPTSEVVIRQLHRFFGLLFGLMFSSIFRYSSPKCFWSTDKSSLDVSWELDLEKRASRWAQRHQHGRARTRASDLGKVGHVRYGAWVADRIYECLACAWRHTTMCYEQTSHTYIPWTEASKEKVTILGWGHICDCLAVKACPHMPIPPLLCLTGTFYLGTAAICSTPRVLLLHLYYRALVRFGWLFWILFLFYLCWCQSKNIVCISHSLEHPYWSHRTHCRAAI